MEIFLVPIRTSTTQIEIVDVQYSYCMNSNCLARDILDY